MEIKTKYEIGIHVWHVFEDDIGGVVRTFDDYIDEIIVGKQEISYILKECCEEVKEENIVPYENYEELGKLVVKKMNEIREREKENG